MSDFTHAASDDPDPVVLVVDDTDAVREVVCAMLRRHGFEVRVAANGRDSLDVYHELVQRGHDVTVLLDVQMPGLDGPLVLAALQATDPGVRAYFMTGDPGQYSEDDLLALGAGRVFAKPLDLPVMAAELRRGARAEDRAAPVIVSAG
jgi:two-component system, OmpR family, response regulator